MPTNPQTADLPAHLEVVLTERFTELGNPFSEMRRREQGPDGWPASHPVGPHQVAEVLRELLAAAPAVPSAPADRAAILREAADAVRDQDLGPRGGMSRDYENGWWNSRAAAEDRVRRMADEAQQPAPLRAELKPGQLLGDVPDEPLPQTERLVGGRRLTRDEAQQPETRKACGCGQDGCEYCDVDEEQPETPCARCDHGKGAHNVSGCIECPGGWRADHQFTPAEEATQ